MKAPLFIKENGRNSQEKLRQDVFERCIFRDKRKRKRKKKVEKRKCKTVSNIELQLSFFILLFFRHSRRIFVLSYIWFMKVKCFSIPAVFGAES